VNILTFFSPIQPPQGGHNRAFVNHLVEQRSDRICRFVAIHHASVAELFEDVVAEGFPLRPVEVAELTLLRTGADTPKNPNSSSATLTADVVEGPLEWHARLAGSPAVPQSVELLEPAFALRPQRLCYRRTHTEFPDEVFEQDLLFRTG
jgi:hypothetical protein